MNSEKVAPELRNILLFQIGNTKFKNLDEKAGKIIQDPFFGTGKLTPANLDNKNIEATLAKLGYYKKDALLTELTKKPEATIALKSPVEFNSYFNAPTNKKWYFTKETDILLSGNAPETATVVYVNDYQLKGFVPASHKFYFRAKTDIGTLKEGVNTYTLSFLIDGKKVSKETMTIYYSQNQEDLDQKAAEINAQVVSQKAVVSSEVKKQIVGNKELSAKIDSLYPLYYYSKDFKKFTLEIDYTSQSSYIKPIAETVADSLKLIGIDTNLRELSTDDIQNTIGK